MLDIRRLKNTVRCWTFVRDMKCDMGVLQWARHPRNYLREFAVEVCAPEQVESRGWMSGHCAFAACQYFPRKLCAVRGYSSPEVAPGLRFGLSREGDLSRLLTPLGCRGNLTFV